MRCASSPGKCAASCSVMLTVISPAHSGGGDVDDGPAEEEDAPDADADGRCCKERHPHGTAIVTVRPSSERANIGPSSPKLHGNKTVKVSTDTVVDLGKRENG